MAFPLAPDADHCLYRFPSHRVYAREAWGAAWGVVPYLYANWVYWGCSPEPARAELAWRYGTGIQAGESAPADYAPVDLVGQYIKIEIDQEDAEGNPADPLLWHGLVDETGDVQFGTSADLAPSGSQTLVCHGLETLLDRTYVTASWCLDAGGEEMRIGRGLQFNADHDFLDPLKTPLQRSSQRYGNRSINAGPKLCYLFATDLATAKLWSTWDIVMYLFGYFCPAGPGGEATIPWGLTGRALDLIYDWDSPIVKADGISVKKILDQLFDRRRLYTWRVVVEDDEPKIDVFNFNHAPIMLPSGAVQRENADTAALSYDLAVDVHHASLKQSTLHRADRVVCRGSRKRACFTIAAADGTLEPDWKDQDETAYEAGPSGIGSLNVIEREFRVRNYRREDRFHRVYAAFRVPRDWDHQVGDGAGGDWKKPFFPDDEERGAEKIYWPEAHLERQLIPGLIEAAPDQSPEDALEMAAWIKTHEESGLPRYQHVEKIRLNRTMAFLEDLPLIDFSCSIRPQERALGIWVKASGGGEWGQEAIAKTDFTQLEGIDRIAPPLDWREMAVTVALDLDSRVEGAWPPLTEFQGQTIEVARVLVIDLGDHYRLDYVAPQTVKGCVDGELQREDMGGYYRDDRQKLQDIARLVYEWYARDRKALTLVLRDIALPAGVGTILTTVNRAGEQIDVYTPVTSIHVDLVGGVTTLQTDFAELDPNQL
jgi:hypothetical protein